MNQQLRALAKIQFRYLADEHPAATKQARQFIAEDCPQREGEGVVAELVVTDRWHGVCVEIFSETVTTNKRKGHPMRALSLLIFGLTLILANQSASEAAPTGRYVTVWLLELRYTPTDTWHNAGKYTSYASAQQSYAIRARHGGYTEMRIRQTQEWQSYLRDKARIAPGTRYRDVVR